ncbi:hypothetical protein [Pseudomonas syringae group sp. J309-1]|uniref:hypothetical protein n=1 Tax=Pseudomonas syringae group sp. J309-1 TaxID=3079588 RepID=UPI00291194A7|nr:hypothetical protein [Pseudomonas syringae group sp. J309-1]MDU8357655.1 hypothetical protein [Pseudomonas syringae group sp. J309-1]
MKQLSNSLIIFDLLKGKLERDLYLIEFSVSLARKYGRRCKGLDQFNEDLKQSLFLKQVIDVCAFLDEFKAFRSLAKESERVKSVCRATKPALQRIEELKGLRDYRNALAAHNFRVEGSKDEVILLSDYTKSQDYPNSIAELFFLSSLCITIIEAVCTEFNSELRQALTSYELSLEDDSDIPLRGTKTIREAYDGIEKYRIKLDLQPKFIEHEFTEINMALRKLNWSVIPKSFQLAEDETNKAWSIVLGMYFGMRGYQDIKYYQGTKGHYTSHWLELYGYAIAITDELGCFKPSGMRRVYSIVSSWDTSTEESSSQQIQFVYDELMKVVTP